REEKDTLNLNERFLATDDRYLGLPVTERAETKTEYYKAYFEKEIRLLPPGKTGKTKKGAAPAPTADKPTKANAQAGEKAPGNPAAFNVRSPSGSSRDDSHSSPIPPRGGGPGWGGERQLGSHPHPDPPPSEGRDEAWTADSEVSQLPTSAGRAAS